VKNTRKQYSAKEEAKINNNKTAHLAAEYDEKIKSTIPNYECFHDEVIDLVKAVNPIPRNWLDTGCGTGSLVLKAAAMFGTAEFVLSDPSKEMLDIAKQKLGNVSDNRIMSFTSLPTQDINMPSSTFDVITAIQSHHYLDLEMRRKATQNCYRMLKTGGIYVTFENIRPYSDKGIEVGLNRWKNFQIKAGKAIDEADNHIARFGKEYFPISITEHLEMMRSLGFSVSELLWGSYMQAGFYAIKS
jgi:tRNA (cmo5U34)-methyltransferase